MADTTAANTVAPVEEKPKNHVRVSSKKSKFLFVDIVKYNLNEGEDFVEISGLAGAISEVVEIAEILKAQGLVNVTAIETGRSLEGRRSLDRMVVRVVKTEGFQKIFDEQQAARKEKENEKEKEKTADAQ